MALKALSEICISIKAQSRCSELTLQPLLTKNDSLGLRYLQTLKPLLEGGKSQLLFSPAAFTLPRQSLLRPERRYMWVPGSRFPGQTYISFFLSTEKTLLWLPAINTLTDQELHAQEQLALPHPLSPGRRQRDTFCWTILNEQLGPSSIPCRLAEWILAHKKSSQLTSFHSMAPIKRTQAPILRLGWPEWRTPH